MDDCSTKISQGTVSHAHDEQRKGLVVNRDVKEEGVTQVQS